MPETGIKFVGFDEDSVEFEITGVSALRLARWLGEAEGWTPQDRRKAVVHVTLFREDLTDANCIDNVHTAWGDDSQANLFDSNPRR